MGEGSGWAFRWRSGTGPAGKAGVRTGVVIITVDGKDMPAFAAATRSLSGAVDFTMEWDGEDQTIVVQHSVPSAVPASFDFTGNMFAITADRMAHCRGREAVVSLRHAVSIRGG